MKRGVKLLLCACAVSSTASLAALPAVAADQTVTLNWLIRSDPAEMAWAKNVITSFQKDNPTIKVNLIIIPQAQIDQKIQTMIAGGNPPDVFMPNWANGGFATYKSDLLPLDSYIKSDPTVLKGFFPKLVRTYSSSGGQVLGIPILSLGSFLFYNKDLFDKAHIPYPPTDWKDHSWTWAKMVSDAEKLAQNKGNQAKEVYGINDALWPENADSWLWGGDYFSKSSYVTGKMGTPDVTNQGVVTGVEQHLKLIQDKISPSPNLTTALSALGDAFLSGRVAMELNGGWGFWTFAPAKFRWGVAPIPWTNGQRRDVLFTDQVSIEKSTKYPAQAWKLVKYIVNPNGPLKALTVDQGATPPQAALLTQWEQQEAKKLGMTVAQIQQLQNGALQYGSESANHLLFGYGTIASTMDQSLNAIYNGHKSVKDGLTEMKQHLEALHLQ